MQRACRRVQLRHVQPSVPLDEHSCARVHNSARLGGACQYAAARRWQGAHDESWHVRDRWQPDLCESSACRCPLFACTCLKLKGLQHPCDWDNMQTPAHSYMGSRDNFSDPRLSTISDPRQLYTDSFARRIETHVAICACLTGICPVRLPAVVWVRVCACLQDDVARLRPHVRALEWGAQFWGRPDVYLFPYVSAFFKRLAARRALLFAMVLLARVHTT